MTLVLFAVLAAAPADLPALAQQHAWAELLERAEATAPAERNDGWRALVASAATEVTRTARIAKDPFGPVEKADALSGRFTFLTGHAPFVAARDAAVVAGLQACFATGDTDCFRLFARYEKTLAPAGSLAAGKALRRAGAFAHRPMVLFAKAVGAKDAAACGDADVAEAVDAGLDAPQGSETAAAARQVAFEWCFAALAPKLKESMRGAGSARLGNTCAAMRARKALTELQDDLCRDVDL